MPLQFSAISSPGGAVDRVSSDGINLDNRYLRINGTINTNIANFTYQAGTTHASNSIDATTQVYGRGVNIAADSATPQGGVTFGVSVSINRAVPALSLNNAGGDLLRGYAGSTLKLKVDTNGTLYASGTTNQLGTGANGAAGSYVNVGHFDSTNAIVAAAGSGTDIALLLQSKGTGSVVLRNGGDTSKALSFNSTGKIVLATSAANYVATVGSAGLATALPANPDNYIIININGTDKQIPVYAIA